MSRQEIKTGGSRSRVRLRSR